MKVFVDNNKEFFYLTDKRDKTIVLTKKEIENLLDYLKKLGFTMR